MIRGLEASLGYGNTNSNSILFINITIPYIKIEDERNLHFEVSCEDFRTAVIEKSTKKGASYKWASLID